MFKILDPTGCTYYEEAFQYNLPGRDETWARTDHPDPGEPDGLSCGPGRLHLKKSLSFIFGPDNAWPWWAKGEGLMGEDMFKASYTTVFLRRISPEVLARILRPPFNWGHQTTLTALCLPRSDLRGAGLTGADLYHANLRCANLQNAELAGANLGRANLIDANLAGANLQNAKLMGTSLRQANLTGANLTGCDLRLADLYFATFDGAILEGARLDNANLTGSRGIKEKQPCQ